MTHESTFFNTKLYALMKPSKKHVFIVHMIQSICFILCVFVITYLFNLIGWRHPFLMFLAIVLSICLYALLNIGLMILFKHYDLGMIFTGLILIDGKTGIRIEKRKLIELFFETLKDGFVFSQSIQIFYYLTNDNHQSYTMETMHIFYAKHHVYRRLSRLQKHEIDELLKDSNESPFEPLKLS